MCYSDKLNILHRKIQDAILPLTKDYNSCVYLDLPYHTNLGDLLIWLGTEIFIKESNLNCTYRNSEFTNHHTYIKDNQLIFLHGGGNFGDVWRSHQEFRLNIIQNYLDHRIIILPQSVYYNDKKLLAHDIEICAKHKNLYICARDRWSYNFLCQHFFNHILLVPDMAYCIPTVTMPISNNGTLFVKRNDHEYVDCPIPFNQSSKFDVRDWPTIGNDKSLFSKYYKWSVFRKLYALHINTETSPQYRFIHDWYLFIWLLNWNSKLGFLLDGFINAWMYRHLLGSIWDIGTMFLSKYKTIYSTRLHVCILSTLMQRSCILIDNVYGKNSNFYKTWLIDFDNIQLLSYNDK